VGTGEALVTRADAWVQAASYAWRGLRCVAQAPRLYLLITGIYATPALLAAALAAFLPEPVLWQQALIVALPWITIVLGTVVIMVALGFQARGQIVDPGRATRVGLRWVPRYVWTNVHTSLIFWVPIGLLDALRNSQAFSPPEAASLEPLTGFLWWLAIIGLALYLHIRTLLAPFLAVHADLPGTLAALKAWRLAGQHFPICFATLVVGSLPVAVPLGILSIAVAGTASGPVEDPLRAAAPDLAWAGIQFLRLVLIPALYLLFRDVWAAEQAGRGRQGGPAVPGLLRAILALTRPLPKLGAWE
jgi:hypothetical protein